jgi:hypothetical protein
MIEPGHPCVTMSGNEFFRADVPNTRTPNMQQMPNYEVGRQTRESRGCLFLDVVNYPGPDGPVVGDIFRLFRDF